MTAEQTYDTIARTYDHEQIAVLPAYPMLRQALSDIGNQAAETGRIKLDEFLDALRDMAATAPFGDTCNCCLNECCRNHHHSEADPADSCTADRISWPYAAKRKGEYVTGTYRCERGHVWTCTYAISIIGI